MNWNCHCFVTSEKNDLLINKIMQINDAYICDSIDGVKETHRERERRFTQKYDIQSEKCKIT